MEASSKRHGRSKQLPILALATFAPWSISTPLAAEVPVHKADSRIKKPNADAPVTVEADRIEATTQTNRVNFAGKVRFRQADLALEAATVQIAYSNGTQSQGPAIWRAFASGGVVVRQGGQVARGKYAIYDVERRLITLIDDVELQNGENRFFGARLVLDLQTRRATLDTSPQSSGRKAEQVVGQLRKQ